MTDPFDRPDGRGHVEANRADPQPAGPAREAGS